MKVLELTESEWSNVPLPDDDPKSTRIAQNRVVSITNQLNIMYHYLTDLRDRGVIELSGILSTEEPPNADDFERLPRSKSLGSVFIKKGIDPKLRSKIIHMVDKYVRIHKLHATASAEATRIEQLRIRKKQQKRELNKLKREQARELERAKKWERK